ncbi:AAA family ATPase [Candidatus Nanohaloarchaea archaeon]|nr:AAA family ATPase [Candidatus Nanohaloarchaea archaeon]
MRPVKILKDFLARVRGWVISMSDKDVNKENDDEGKEQEAGKEQKVQFPQYFQQKKNDNPNSTSLKTPVMRGVVVSEFDGDRIWVEASGNMKGRYGVEVPNGYNPEDFTPGTEVALDPNTFKVTDIVEKGKDAEFEAIDTDVTFQDIGGLDHVVKSLKSNVGAQLNEDKSKKMQEWGIEMDKSMLLVGKPGTGKTHLVKALSNEYDADMFMINGPQMVEKFIGEGAKKVKRLYDQARASDKPAIVFIDEIDAIAKKRLDDRRHGGEEVERTMSQLLSELDGLDTEKDSGVISIFATNTPDIMDPALLNRCSAIEVPVPDTESKEEILRIHTRRMNIGDDVNYTAIAEQFEEGFTGRDIKQIAKQAAVNALERHEDVSKTQIEMEDFESAIKDLKEGNMGVEKDFLSDGQVHPNEMFA